MDIDLNHKIYIAGHRGMVGSACMRFLTKKGYRHLMTRTRDELDLTQQQSVAEFLQDEKPDIVILAAARVGGIWANHTQQAAFLHENLSIAQNIIHGAFQAGVQHLLFLGSSCIYPKFAPQPIPESSLLQSALEPTNEAYALAKIVGLKLCEYYRLCYGVRYYSAMPCNLYGPGDNYHPEYSHVIAALIRKFHQAKIDQASHVLLWGTGQPMREFLHVDDLAAGLFYLLQDAQPPAWTNIGSGQEVSIADLAKMIQKIVGFKGELRYDTSKPDGTPRKLLNNDYIRSLGWSAQIDLETGLQQTYEAYCQSI